MVLEIGVRKEKSSHLGEKIAAYRSSE